MLHYMLLLRAPVPLPYIDAVLMRSSEFATRLMNMSSITSSGVRGPTHRAVANAPVHAALALRRRTANAPDRRFQRR